MESAMSSFSYCIFVLLLLSSFAVCNCSKMVDKKLNYPKEGNAAKYSSKQQGSHATAVAETALKEAARHKRSQSEFSSSEYRDLNDIIDDIEDNALIQAVTPNNAFEKMPPLIYHLLLQKLRQLQGSENAYRVLTPRLGRSIDFRNLDSTLGLGGNVDGDDGGDVSASNMRQQKPFVSRLIKKSVPFKPRLGKRTHQSMLCN